MDEQSSRKPWIGVDLDGTLAEYTHWDDQGESIGEPVQAMLERVRKWLEDGKTVKVFTARASCPIQTELVRVWLSRHGLDDLEITNSKDFDMTELWDDRAVRVQRNTGIVLSVTSRQIMQWRRGNFGRS